MRRNLIVTIVILCILAFLNPSEAKHREMLGKVPAVPSAKALLSGAIDAVTLEYHNYLIFSTTTRLDGSLASIGALGLVFDRR
jgi:hypothetical protein